MTIARVQYAQNQSLATAVATISATLGSTPVRNNLLVAFAAGRMEMTLSNPGWTLLREEFQGQPPWENGDVGARMWYKIAGSSEPTVVTTTQSEGTHRMTLHVVEYEGIDPTNPLDIVWSQHNWSGGYTGHPGLPDYANGLAFYGFELMNLDTGVTSIGGGPHGTITQVGDDMHGYNTSKAGDTQNVLSAVYQDVMNGHYVPDAEVFGNGGVSLNNIPSAFVAVFKKDGERDPVVKSESGGSAPAYRFATNDATRNNLGVSSTGASLIGKTPLAGSVQFAVIGLRTTGFVAPAKTITPPAGWTQLGSDVFTTSVSDGDLISDDVTRFTVWTRIAVGGETTTGTWSWSQLLPYTDTYVWMLYQEYSTLSAVTLDVVPTLHEHYDEPSGLFIGTKPRQWGPAKVTTTTNEEMVFLLSATTGSASGGVSSSASDLWTLENSTGVGSVTAASNFALFRYNQSEKGAVDGVLTFTPPLSNTATHGWSNIVFSLVYTPDVDEPDADPTSLIYRPRLIYPAELPYAVDSRMMEGIDFDA